MPAYAVLSAAAAALLVAAGCGDGSGRASGGTRVVATTTQLEDLAGNVAGERAEVVGLLPPGGDPHDHEPRPSDVEAIADADLVLRSGGDVDLWSEELVGAAGGDSRTVTLLDAVAAGEAGGSADGAEIDVHGDGEGTSHAEAPDPHWWQAPANAIVAVEAIRDELIAVDPEGERAYRTNAAAYLDRLRGLDRRIAECMDGVPARDRKLVTTHDSFGYFAEAYGVEVVGAAIPARTTQAQPSAGETAALVDQIQREGVSAVFPEGGLGVELERAIAEESGATVGEELWADALGPEGSTGETYLDAMAHNAEAMAAGFGHPSCEVKREPPGGS